MAPKRPRDDGEASTQHADASTVVNSTSIGRPSKHDSSSQPPAKRSLVELSSEEEIDVSHAENSPSAKNNGISHTLSHIHKDASVSGYSLEEGSPSHGRQTADAREDDAAREDNSEENDDDDEDDAVDYWMPKPDDSYHRIQPRRRGFTYDYDALVPVPPHRSSSPENLMPFGARFRSAKEAATAADLALVAMWGRYVASPHLNFPIESLGRREEVRCRYGSELVSYLMSIANASPFAGTRNARAKRRAERFSKVLSEERKGFYAYDNLAVRSVSGSDPQLRRTTKEGEEGRPRAMVSFAPHSVVIGGTHGRSSARSIALKWVDNPQSAYPSTQTKKAIFRRMKPSALHAADVSAANEAAVVAASVLEARSISAGFQSLDNGPTPKKLFLPGPHARIMEAVRIAAVGGVSVNFFNKMYPLQLPADDTLDEIEIHGGRLQRMWDADRKGEDARASYCSHCKFPWLNFFHFRACPVLQTAMTIPQEEPRLAAGVCPMCDGYGFALRNGSIAMSKSSSVVLARKLKGCELCRGSMPVTLYRPAAMVSPWVYHVRTGTIAFMHAVQQTANAFIHDFDKPEIADSLGPLALLAIGLLVEEVVINGMKHTSDDA